MGDEPEARDCSGGLVSAETLMELKDYSSSPPGMQGLFAHTAPIYM